MTYTATLDGGRARRVIVAFAVSCLLVAGVAPAVQALGRQISVIVSSTDSSTAADLVRSTGGTVTADLPIVDGVAANVPSSRLADLAARAQVVANRSIKLTSRDFESASSFDGSSLTSPWTAETGAPALWDNGYTGAGQTVALIDTGVADVADLGSRVVAEANVTTESTADDTFGHGTFQAGLVAGDGSSSGGRYAGVAPRANVMSVKVADADGSTSLIQVLVGAQIVDSAAKRFNVRVALVALSSESPLPPEIDPLTRALRKLWAHGIVVVVPAGNDGPTAETISSPGEDPVLLTAGSVNDEGTGSFVDDVVSEYSGHGPTRWGMDKPDVVAPGEHVVSLRAPGSTVDNEHPGSRVEDAYFKGSGTSMSAAVTAGAAALVVDAHPDWSPDQVKASLMASANALPDEDFASQGAGVVDAAGAVAGGTVDDLPDVPDLDDDLPPVGGEFARNRGGRYVWMGRTWAGRSWDARSWDARSWDGRTWDGRSWDARSWDGRSWDARTWDARTWDARSWEARQWASRTWAARTWASRTWASRSWDSRTWAGRTWESRSWDSRTWDSRSWASRQWASRTWESRTWEAAFFTSRTWESRTWSSRTWSSRTWSSRTWSSRSWSSVDWT